jgi:periplasmic protein TonB
MRLTLEAAPPRLSLSVLLAVPLVYALFLAASLLIKVDELVLTKAPDRVLTPLVMPQDKPLTPEIKRPLIEMALIEKPPAFERPRVDTVGGAPDYTFTAPESDIFTLGKLQPPVATVIPVAGRDIEALRAPAPSVPAAAISRGISGSCDVMFDVDVRGRPFNLTAQCTNDLFKAEAIRAVSKAEFLPKVRNGAPVEQRGAIYPIEFVVK